MGANTGAKVAALVPKAGGGVYFARAGTALPTDASTALAGTYQCLGAVSSDGVKPSRDVKADQVKEWDGTTLAVLKSDNELSYEFTLESILDSDTLGYVFGSSNVTVTAPSSTSGTKTAIVDKGDYLSAGVVIFEMRYGGKKIRDIVPMGDPAITGEEAYQASGLTGYTVSLAALKDATGVRYYRYIEDTDKTA